jgi:hypothetical protein
VQLAVVAGVLFTAVILEPVPDRITSPVTLIVFVPAVAEIPLRVTPVILRLPAIFNVVFAAGPPFAAAYTRLPYVGQARTVVVLL